MPLINVFLVSSTYLIVLTALMRYLAVASPFTGRTNCFVRHSSTASLCVCCIVTLMVLPQFFVNNVVPATRVHSISNLTNETQISVQYTMKFRFAYNQTLALGKYILHVQPVLFSFVPGFLLVLFNVGLIRCLRRAKEERRYVCVGQRVTTSAASGSTSCRLSVTLVVMFTAHVLLVVPSDVIKYFALYNLEAADFIACALNLAQAINFSFNFLLYISLNTAFRDAISTTFSRLFGCKKQRFSSSESGAMMQMQMESLRLSYSGGTCGTPRYYHSRLATHSTPRSSSSIGRRFEVT